MPGDKADVVMFGPKPIIEEALDEGRLHACTEPWQRRTRTPSSPRSRRRCAPSRRWRATARSTARSCRAFPSSRSCRASASATTTSTPNGRAQHGIIVTNTPDVLNEEVADTALGLLLAHRAPSAAGRALSARRQLAEARRLPAHALAARPHRRHRRHGPHRQGDRAPARRHEGAGGLSLAPAGRRRLQALSEPRRDGARRRRADRHHARAAPRPRT